MLTDKRVAALIISFAMLASTFYVGPAFAAENTDSTDSDVNTEYTVPEEELQEEQTGGGEETLEPEAGPDQDAQGVEESTEPETEPEAEPELGEPEAVQEETEAEDPTVQLMGRCGTEFNKACSAQTGCQRNIHIKNKCFQNQKQQKYQDHDFQSCGMPADLFQTERRIEYRRLIPGHFICRMYDQLAREDQTDE